MSCVRGLQWMLRKKSVFTDEGVSCHFTSFSASIRANNSCILIATLNHTVATLKRYSVAVAVLLAKEADAYSALPSYKKPRHGKVIQKDYKPSAALAQTFLQAKHLHIFSLRGSCPHHTEHQENLVLCMLPRWDSPALTTGHPGLLQHCRNTSW